VSGPRHPPVRKSLGQHFLTDARILARIADALALTGSETVIEVGPGRGALTDLLAERAARVIAVEVDRLLVPRLRARYAERPHVTIVEADVLTTDLGALAGGPFVLAGNVPYYITTPILFHALEHPRADRAVYLVQKEVAERVVAAPGSAAYGALSVNVQAVATATLCFGVKPGAFAPPPRVDSAVIRVVPRPDPVVPPHAEAAFKRLVLAAFAQRRKQLKAVVRGVAGVDTAAADALVRAAGLDPTARPETLGPAQFAALLARLGDRAGGPGPTPAAP
jgi:16S rRNA (adenine1518-N6/adenine1519-N6)-dimethyltransferase